MTKKEKQRQFILYNLSAIQNYVEENCKCKKILNCGEVCDECPYFISLDCNGYINCLYKIAQEIKDNINLFTPYCKTCKHFGNDSNYEYCDVTGLPELRLSLEDCEECDKYEHVFKKECKND